MLLPCQAPPKRTSPISGSSQIAPSTITVSTPLDREPEPTPASESTQGRVLRAFISAPPTLIVCGAILSLTLLFPFIEDNIPQAYIARRLLHRELPYVGTWDQNYPGVLIFHLLALILSPSALAFRFVDLIFELWMVWVLYDLGKRIHSQTAGMFASLLYSLYYVLNGIDDLAGQKDVFAAIALVTAVWLLVRSNYRSVNLAGLLAGIAVLIRPTYGLHVAVLAGAMLWICNAERIRTALKFLTFAVLPMLIFCGFYATIGHFRDFWEATFLFTTSVYNPQPRVGILATSALYRGLIPPMAVLGLIVLFAKSPRRREGVLLGGMLIASLASSLILWGYRYHYQPFVTFEFLCAGVAVGYALTELLPWIVRSSSMRSILTLVLAILIIVLEFRGTTMSGLIRDSIRDRNITRASIDQHFAAGAYDPLGEQQLANYVVRHSSKGERMESFYTTVYPQYLADLQPANRFILTIPLLMRNASGSFSDFQKRWQREYSDSMLRVQPRWFLISDPKDTAGIGERGMLPRRMLHETFPEIEAMIQSRYHRDTTIGVWTLYTKN